MNLKIFRLKSEMEVQRRYPDILLIPRNKDKGYKAVMIEFKYLKKENADKLKEKEQEAIEQLKEYSEIEEIKEIENLNKYAVIAVGSEIKVINI